MSVIIFGLLAAHQVHTVFSVKYRKWKPVFASIHTLYVPNIHPTLMCSVWISYIGMCVDGVRYIGKLEVLHVKIKGLFFTLNMQ